MKRALTSPAVVSLVLGICFVGFCWQWFSKENERAFRDQFEGKEFVGRDGKKEAEADIASGNLRLKPYGKERAGFVKWRALCRERLGVSIDPLAGCFVNKPLVEYADAYNAEVRRFIAEKFGPTVFEEIDNEAMRFPEAKQKE